MSDGIDRLMALADGTILGVQMNTIQDLRKQVRDISQERATLTEQLKIAVEALEFYDREWRNTGQGIIAKEALKRIRGEA